MSQFKPNNISNQVLELYKSKIEQVEIKIDNLEKCTSKSDLGNQMKLIESELADLKSAIDSFKKDNQIKQEELNDLIKKVQGLDFFADKRFTQLSKNVLNLESKYQIQICIKQSKFSEAASITKNYSINEIKETIANLYDPTLIKNLMKFADELFKYNKNLAIEAYKYIYLTMNERKNIDNHFVLKLGYRLKQNNESEFLQNNFPKLAYNILNNNIFEMPNEVAYYLIPLKSKLYPGKYFDITRNLNNTVKTKWQIIPNSDFTMIAFVNKDQKAFVPFNNYDVSTHRNFAGLHRMKEDKVYARKTGVNLLNFNKYDPSHYIKLAQTNKVPDLSIQENKTEGLYCLFGY